MPQPGNSAKLNQRRNDLAGLANCRFGWTAEVAQRGIVLNYQPMDDPLKLESALRTPRFRGSALRTLLLCEDTKLKQLLFPCLVELASVGHSDIGLVRSVIATFPREWAAAAIISEVERVLEKAPPPPWEEFRRFAELYREQFPSLLPALTARALAHHDPDVREVGEDFGVQDVG